MAYGNYPNLDHVKRVLVIKLRHHGDVLLSSPVFSSLKAHLPRADIDALVYQETAPMLEGHLAIAHMHLYDPRWKQLPRWRRWWHEIKFLLQIRRQRYDLVINLTEGDRGAIIAWISRAPIRVGIDPGRGGFWNKRSVFSHLVKPCPTPRHAVERNLDALRKIGIFPSETTTDLTWYTPEEARRTVAAFHLPSRYLLIHPTSRWKFKCWPVEQVAQLISLLHNEGMAVVMSSGPHKDEVEMVHDIARLCATVPLINVAGKTSLKELGALIQGATLLVCVDSVPLHIASACKTPVVALFGPTSELNWGPWKNPHAKVVTRSMGCRPCGMDGCGGSKRSECLVTLSPSTVVETISYLLKYSHANSVRQ